jgi:DNA mismatch endonuclease (patch repair protein)
MAAAPIQVPAASSPAVRRRMQATRGRDTGPELALRRELHRRGLRYRVDAPVVPGLRRRADLVFPRARVAVFVDGCFWHGCPQHATTAKTNAAFWAAKIMANQARDADTTRRLSEAGWTVVRIWGHDTPATAADHVQAILRRAAETSVAGPSPSRAGKPGTRLNPRHSSRTDQNEQPAIRMT